MRIEAEIKAVLRDRRLVRQRLDQWALGASERYYDAYFDTGDERLERTGRELRIRTIDDGRQRHLLTYKEAAVDRVTESKPEFEAEVSDRAALEHVLSGLGFVPGISFVKKCMNYRFVRDGRDCLATHVVIEEIEGEFLEIETLVPETDLDAALATLRSAAADLGIGPEDLTVATYTGAVRAARARTS